MLRLERCLIDRGYGKLTEQIYKFCRRSPHAAILHPSHGRYHGPLAAGDAATSRRSRAIASGLNWRMPATSAAAGPCATCCSTRTSGRGSCTPGWRPPGAPGTLALFGDDGRRGPQGAEAPAARRPPGRRDARRGDGAGAHGRRVPGEAGRRQRLSSTAWSAATWRRRSRRRSRRRRRHQRRRRPRRQLRRRRRRHRHLKHHQLNSKHRRRRRRGDGSDSATFKSAGKSNEVDRARRVLRRSLRPGRRRIALSPGVDRRRPGREVPVPLVRQR
jgi:hypothetical protein